MRPSQAFRSLLLVALALSLFADGANAWAKDPVARSLSSVSAQERAAIDARAIELPSESLLQQQLEFWGDLTGWIVARSPLPLEEEVRSAAAAHDAMAAQSRFVATPEWAETVFKKLVETLPARMRPDAYSFTLTIVDDQRVNASTLGAGRIDLTRGALESVSADADHRSDRLAFVLAREIGHVCDGHCRWGYQLQRLQKEIDGEIALHINRELLTKLIEQSIQVSGKLVTFLYSPEQESKADLFALQLCRNAGFDLESGLDVLRRLVEPDAKLDAPPAARDAKDKTDSRRLSPLARLQRLRNELDGRIVGDEYGMFEFHRQTGGFTRLADHSLAPGEKAIVFVHGIDSHFDIYERALDYVAGLEKTKEVRLLCFHYPNDDSIARSGKYLRNELARVCDQADTVDFICHSAGGLVFRYYAEVERGAFHRAVLQGTPHAGSDMVKLRMLLEAQQFARGLRLGLPESVEMALRDGKGQISFDLQPDSLFLQFLNKQKRDGLVDRYYIFRGKAIESQAGLRVLEVALVVAKLGLRQKIARSGHSELLTECADAVVEALVIPEEVSNGDLAVSLESASLKGATFMATYPVNHIALVKDRTIIKAVVGVILGAPGDGKAER